MRQTPTDAIALLDEALTAVSKVDLRSVRDADTRNGIKDGRAKFQIARKYYAALLVKEQEQAQAQAQAQEQTKKKAPAPAFEPKKRGPGRPKKAVATDGSAPKKRGPGRPRKSAETTS